MNVVRRSVVALALALVGTTVSVSTASAATAVAPADYAGRLAQRVNAARADHGVAPLSIAAGTNQVAAAWTAHQAAAGAISHNAHLEGDLEAHGSANWTTYGENVGTASASNPDELFTAYMNSPEHRANILDPTFHILGIAVVDNGAQAYNTMDFVDTYSDGSAPAAAPAPARAAAAPAPVVRPAAPAPAPVVRHTAPRPVVRHVTVRRPAAVRKPVAKRAPAKRAVVAHRVTVLRVRTTSAPAPVKIDTQVLGLSVTTGHSTQGRTLAATAALLLLLLAGVGVLRSARR